MRQLIGYGPFEGERAATLLDELYATEWNPFRSFFCPVMKHVRTEQVGHRQRRHLGWAGYPLRAALGLRETFA